MSEAYLTVSISYKDPKNPKPYLVRIYSESPDTITRVGKPDTLAIILQSEGSSYQKARDEIIDRIGRSLAISGERSEYIWIVPLMDQSEINSINDKIDEVKCEDNCSLYNMFELEKPR